MENSELCPNVTVELLTRISVIGSSTVTMETFVFLSMPFVVMIVMLYWPCDEYASVMYGTVVLTSSLPSPSDHVYVIPGPPAKDKHRKILNEEH